MRPADLLRYGLFAGVAATAEANRRHYHMTTTWLPHLAMNTLALLLPDLLRPALTVAAPSQDGPTGPTAEFATLTANTLRALVCDNTSYVGYVAPLAVGYLLSHPDFNVYKGEWGEMQLAGFGFDALPHAAAGFALSAAVIDTVREASQHMLPAGLFAPLLKHAAERPAALALGALLLVTAFWEVGEYRIHLHELEQRGDISQINMQWSMADTVTDCVANLVGWAAAAAWRASPRATELRYPAYR